MRQLEITRPDSKLAAYLEQFRKEHADDPLGDVATRVLHEDERVKIWEMELEPGAASDLHRHERDYYLVMLAGDRIVGLPKQTSDGDAVVLDLPRGASTLRIEKGATEWAVNVGKERFYEILIELKS
ncbi:MAG: hypothetical protein V3V67_08940 [Myxococcota bacterium]